MNFVKETRPQLVIFDLDGTLTDSASGVISSFEEALRTVGAEIPSGDLASLVVGPPMGYTMTTLGLGDDRAAEAVAAYRADYSTRGWAINSVYDGVVELLDDLRTAGVRMAIATSKAEPIARRILEHHNLASNFEVIAGSTMNGDRAAKVDVLTHALKQLQPLPDSVVMVGDRSHDVEGASEHGIATVVVGWGYGQADFVEPLAVKAVAHVKTMAELREVLGV